MSTASTSDLRTAFYEVISDLWQRSDVYVEDIAADIDDSGGNANAAGTIHIVRDSSSFDPDYAAAVVERYTRFGGSADTMSLDDVEEILGMDHGGNPADARGVNVATENPSGSDAYTLVFDPSAHVDV